jgi:hypothetical protein
MPSVYQTKRNQDQVNQEQEENIMPRIAHWDFSGQKNSKWVQDQENGDADWQDGYLMDGGKITKNEEAKFDGKNDYMYVSEAEDFSYSEGTITMRFSPDDLKHGMGLVSRESAEGTPGNLSIHMTTKGKIEVRHVAPDGKTEVYSGGEVAAKEENSFSYSWSAKGSVLTVNETVVATGDVALDTFGNQGDMTFGAAIGSENPTHDWYNWNSGSHDDDDDIWDHALGSAPPLLWEWQPHHDATRLCSGRGSVGRRSRHHPRSRTNGDSLDRV